MTNLVTLRISHVYRWMARYREGGLEGLKFKGIPGKEPKLFGTQIKRSTTS